MEHLSSHLVRWAMLYLQLALCQSISTDSDMNFTAATAGDGGVKPLSGNRPYLLLNLTSGCAKEYYHSNLDNSSASWPVHSVQVSDCLQQASLWNPTGASVRQKHCTVTYLLTENDLVAPAQYGMCVPSSCSISDTLLIFNAALSTMKINVSNSVSDCHGATTVDQKALVALSIFALLALLLLVGTAVDVSRAACRYATAALNRSNEDVFSAVYSVPTSPTDESTPLLSRSFSRLAQPLPPPPSLDEKQGTVTKVLLAFSAYSNGKKLLSSRVSSDSWLRCLHGLRFISICWISQSYTFTYLEKYYGNLRTSAATDLSQISVLSLSNSILGTDTLFLLSGILVMFLILKELDESNGKLGWRGWIMLYVHRLLRITPIYGFILMMWSCLAVFFCDAPSWPAAVTAMSLDPPCLSYWWTNMMYINDIYPNTTSPCMAWSWFIAADMQFFVITPILAYCTYRCLYFGIILIMVLISSSTFTAAVVTVLKGTGLGFTASSITGSSIDADIVTSTYFNSLYSAPWCRFQSYGIGLIVAIFIFRGKHRAHLPLPLVVTSWISATTTCLAMIYAPPSAGSYSNVPSVAESAIYNSLGRVAWCVAVSWMIWSCCCGNAGWINTCLSWRALVPLSRLAYGAYIIQPMLVIVSGLGSGQMLYVGGIVKVYYFVASVILAYIISFLTILLIEAPIMALEKMLIKKS